MSTNEIFYKQPGESWYEGIPIGNGRLGGMVEGGANCDHMYLNEETLWAGKPGEHERDNPYPSVKKARQLLFAGRTREAEKVIVDEILPEDPWFGSYQVLGELTVRSLYPLEYKNYDRRLFLKKGTVEVCFEKNGAEGGKYRKEYFVSAVHQVIAVRYTAPKGSALSLDVSLTRQREASTEILDRDCLAMEGQIGTGVKFAAVLKAVIKGGTIEKHYVRKHYGPSLLIHDAEEATFFVAADSSFVQAADGILDKALARAEEAASAGWDAVKQAHLEDYGNLYGDFELDLEADGIKALEKLTVRERLERVKQGEKDENLYALWVKYCRYVLISSSREGCLPSTLQGIWNYQFQAPWESDFHANINLQINYWPAALYGLARCEEPLFDFMKKLAESGAKTAEKYYRAGGWVLHHATNAFAHTAPCAVQAGYWPMGGAWLARHCFEHYEYTGDEKFLAETAFPLMKGAAEFLIDFLVEIPSGLPGEGMLTTNPSHSPENRYLNNEGRQVYFTYGASMDYEIIRDLFGLCKKAIAILRNARGEEYEKAFERQMESVLVRIPDTRVSKRTGCILEWMEDYPEADPGHRHMSHLYGIYPARRITLEKQPDLARAAIRTLDKKMANNYDGQGWSFGWMACLRAVLLQGEEGYQALSHILLEHMQYNLFVDAHGVLQVGDMQAVPMAVLEMLVQLREERLVLLPALPSAWKSGSVKGLHVKGGCVLDMTWRDGRVIEVRVDESHKFKDYPITDKDGSCRFPLVRA